VRPSATREPTRRQVLTDFRRREILAAAIKVFGRKGFAAASVDDIAAAAKIAKGTLYLYFKSKEEIYATAVHLAAAQVQELAAGRLQSARGLREKLSAAVEVRMDFWQEHPGLYRLLLTVGREPKHRRQTHELLRTGHAQILSILEEAASAGELPSRGGSAEDLSALAWAILDMIRGFNERRMDRIFDHPGGNTPQQDAAAITAIALDHLGLRVEANLRAKRRAVAG
jgi:AcrR family transcriptional regulator